ncbi:MAG TPA: tRNA uridine-5-carboxymethylaminomethyl(34) synthesis GTPase MnmE, partial [Candidatus Kryptonia bacterium]|nr:tRNA uridine-5-carboxymethylaminomethyl(34) synthesis GTPase MnmE [Candidatus Kryptonia bacterium]
DLPSGCDEAALRSKAGALVRVSALQGTGLDALRAAVVRAVSSERDWPSNAPTVTLARHRDALEKTLTSLQLALSGARQQRPPELVAVDVQDAADHLAAITGVITSQDVLDRIFSEFCIGK